MVQNEPIFYFVLVLGYSIAPAKSEGIVRGKLPLSQHQNMGSQTVLGSWESWLNPGQVFIPAGHGIISST